MEFFNKKLSIEKTIEYLTYSIIFFIVSGPAIPDLISTFAAIYFLYKILKNKILNENLFFIILSFLLILIPNFFSNYFPYPFIEQLVNVRYFLFALFISSLAQLKLKIIINFILICTLFISFDLIFQYIFKFNLFGIPIDPSHASSRASSLFGEELIAGTFILKFSFPVIGYYIFHKKYLIAFSLTNLFLIAIIFSGERMALILFLFGLFILSFLIKDIKNIILVALTLMIILFSSYFIFDRFKLRIDTFFLTLGLKNEKFSDFGHGAHFMTAYEIFKNNKVFGTGHKTFRISCDLDEIKKNIDSKSQGCTTHPHNNYLEVLSDSGLFGFFGFILFASFLIIKAMKNKLFNSELCGFLVTAIVIFWPISSIGNFFNNRSAVVNFFIFGVILYFSNKNLFSYSQEKN